MRIIDDSVLEKALKPWPHKPPISSPSLACTKLEEPKLKCGIGHSRLKAQPCDVDLKARCHQLGQFRAKQ